MPIALSVVRSQAVAFVAILRLKLAIARGNPRSSRSVLSVGGRKVGHLDGCAMHKEIDRPLAGTWPLRGTRRRPSLERHGLGGGQQIVDIFTEQETLLYKPVKSAPRRGSHLPLKFQWIIMPIGAKPRAYSQQRRRALHPAVRRMPIEMGPHNVCERTGADGDGTIRRQGSSAARRYVTFVTAGLACSFEPQSAQPGSCPSVCHCMMGREEVHSRGHRRTPCAAPVYRLRRRRTKLENALRRPGIHFDDTLAIQPTQQAAVTTVSSRCPTRTPPI